MLAGMRLVRRLGLAIGAWFFVYYLAYYFNSNNAAQSYAFMMAIGAAILAFFLPRVDASSFTESDKESA